MHDIDTPTPELPPVPAAPRSVDTTVPVAQAQRAGDPRAAATQQPGEPQLPHERDQSVGMTDGNPSAAVQQAYRDVARGLVDTDAGRRAHNVGKPVNPPEPPTPGGPGPVEPDQR